MRNFKRLLALLVMGSALSTIFAAGADVVVLMDSSGTILPWFDEINDRILVDITKKFVREGDTFHLVSFNSRVNLEIAQPVATEADVSRIVSRFMLLYPLGQNSDFLSGLQYIWQYVSSLDPQREKIIIVISDGIFNPPASSRYAAYSPDQVRTEISDVSRRIRGAGWNVYYIKLPFPKDAEIRTLDGNLLSNATDTPETKNSSSRDSIAETKKTTADKKNQTSTGVTTPGNSVHKYYDVSTEFTSDLAIESSPLPENGVPITFIDQVFSMPEVTFPADIGKQGRFFILPLKVANNSDAPVNMELTEIYTDNDVNILSENSFLNLSARSNGTLRAQINLPETFTKGPQDISMRLHFSDNLRILPQSATVHVNITGFSIGQFFRTGSSVLFALIFVAIAIILVLFLFLFIMRRTAKPATDAIREANASQKQTYTPETEINTTAKITGRKKVASMQSNVPATANISTASSILSEASAATTAKRNSVDYHTEKKEYPTAASVSGKLDVSSSINAVSTQQNDDKNERISVLANAAVKRIQRVQNNRKGANAGEQIEIKGSSRIMVELDVHNQTTNIGKRNIHLLKAGSRFSLGGGQSSFLVFLVKFPAHIAEIRYDGEECNLAILKPEYFPYETENVIRGCIGKTFTIVSDKNYEVTFGFRIYEDPVTKLNRMLTSFKY